MLATIDLPAVVHVESPLHVGTGYARGLVGRTIVRNRHGHVYLPGSSLKGRLRDACERLARRYRVTVCGSPRPRDMCRAWDPCLVCRIFGSPGGVGSSLIVDDGHLVGDWVEAVEGGFGQVETRTQMQLSRRRGVATEGRLFASEFAAKGLRFETRITGRLDLTLVLDQPGRYYEIILLLGGLKLIKTLGGGNSRGIGRCHVELPAELPVMSDNYDLEHLNVDAMLERLDFLEWYAEQMAEGDTE
ncbi:MAG: RAMP superfamily CRISPR-associated protein [Ardenticatenaceae bacterium]|nr:RAMP superfamily CRISPR-associated protein [Ardenticatenaceae bacterium]